MTRLDVRGGAGGISARLDDMDLAGRRLAALGTGLSGSVPRMIRVQQHLETGGGQLVAPGSYLAAQQALAVAVGGPRGLVPTAGALLTLGGLLRSAAAGYRTADGSAAAAMGAVQDGWGRALGATIGAPLLLGTALGVAALTAVAPDAARAAGERGVRLAAGHAGLAQLLLGTLPSVGAGLLSAVPPPVIAALTGAVGGPDDIPSVAAALLQAGLVVGMLREGRPWLRDPARVRLTPGPRARVVPTAGIGGLVRRVPHPGPERGAVRVDRIDAADGSRRWVVAVPGTADWGLAPDRTPFDLTSDVGLMAGRRTAGATAVVETMRASGIRPGEPVLLTGHSQGGIIAASVAVEPDVQQRFSVTHVVTTGAPVATVPVPDPVQVLSIEHADDLVPSLDGARNPDRASWVTVSTPAPAGDTAPLVAHRQGLYERTADAVDRDPDPSLQAWRAGAAPFLGRPGDTVTTQTWTVVRGE